MTDDELVQLSELRAELRVYVERHDMQHDELMREHAAAREAHAHELDLMRTAVDANTSWRVERQAFEKVGRYLIGSNVGVLLAVGGLVAANLR